MRWGGVGYRGGEEGLVPDLGEHGHGQRLGEPLQRKEPIKKEDGSIQPPPALRCARRERERGADPEQRRRHGGGGGGREAPIPISGGEERQEVRVRRGLGKEGRQ